MTDLLEEERAGRRDAAPRVSASGWAEEVIVFSFPRAFLSAPAKERSSKSGAPAAVKAGPQAHPEGLALTAEEAPRLASRSRGRGAVQSAGFFGHLMERG